MKVRRLKHKRPTRDEPQTCVVTLTDPLPFGRPPRLRWMPDGSLAFMVPHHLGCESFRVHMYSSEPPVAPQPES
jgi:hypothetical protein